MSTEARQLMSREPTELSSGELLSVVRFRHSAAVVPPCPVCGGALSIASAGGGHATKWACSRLEDDPDDPGRLRRKANYDDSDQHYRRSQWIQYREDDPWVLEMAARFQAMAEVQ